MIVGSLGATGRALPITRFIANSGTGTILSGTTTGPALDFLLTGWSGSGNLNFTLDAVLPVLGDDQSVDNAGTAGFYIYADKDPAFPSSGLSDVATIAVRRAIRLVKIRNLRFGAIVKNPGGAGQVTVDENSDNSRAVGGTYPPTALPSPTFGRGLLSVAGEPGTNFNLSFSPANSLAMSNGTDILNVSLVKSASGNITLPLSGELEVGLGGTINIPKAKPTGDYEGAVLVSAVYN
ncbi:hypothetical protein ASE00_12665 [Sphingomonas sp. Root710]|uniref:DUF4402 domain-containing protein n=1 Tax=Sphingomonas sp. Root710 TaxID=1736594 RepID=UPI0006FADAFF|nr:DUF4402 domain-containing protein [Sphingomonas sp. Root710]KRB82862.1 hypothetical protein ASE00_12665 [Sphingomonas sp. Root710]